MAYTLNGVELRDFVQFGPSHGFINQLCSYSVVSGGTAYSIIALVPSPLGQTMSSTCNPSYSLIPLLGEVCLIGLFSTDEAVEAPSEESTHHGNPAERWQY